jgi:NADH-quinone oxidoreductase subunit N
MKENLTYFLPEFVLVATIVLLFFVDFLFGDKKKGAFAIISSVGVLGMMLANWQLGFLAPLRFFSNMMVFDPMSSFFNYLFGGAFLLAVVLSLRSDEVRRSDEPSYYTLLVAITLGMMLLAGSNHLLMIYLSLEMVSVLSYVLTGYVRDSRRSSEAALKYVRNVVTLWSYRNDGPSSHCRLFKAECGESSGSLPFSSLNDGRFWFQSGDFSVSDVVPRCL